MQEDKPIEADTGADAPRSAPPRHGFLTNVLWNWIGVAVNIAVTFILSPIIIRNLGMERYGVWVLLFSTMDYMRILDVGFRAAVSNSCARLRAREDWDGVNRTVTTASLYFASVGLLCLVCFIMLRDHGIRTFNVPVALREEAQILVILIATALTMRFVLAPVSAIIEAFQRFDVRNRAYITGLLCRSFAWLVLVTSGYGLVEMAWVMLATQVLETTILLTGIKRMFPAFSVAPRFLQFNLMGGMFRYGRYSALMSTANLFSLQAPALVIGHLRGPAEVGIFTLPFRVLMYTTEAFAKVAEVTSSVTAEADEAQQKSRVWALAVQTNRHCLAAFLPLAIFMGLYAVPLLEAWVRVPGIARSSGPIIPVLLICYVIAIAGQYNAGAVLIGQAKHGAYSIGVVAEVVATTTCLFLVVPTWGAVGAAWVISIGLTVGRGVYVAFLMCRLNGFSLRRYVVSIYARALAAAVPVFLVALGLRHFILPGRNWPELIAAGGIIAALYFTLAFFYVIDPGVRQRLVRLMPDRLRPAVSRVSA